ncbi:MAG: FtsX-like permease family protein, partial [Bacteroidota bacterium]
STALGEIIHIHDDGDYTIEAIFENFPSNSSLQNDYIYSFENHLSDNDWMREWTNAGMQGAVLLADGADPLVAAEKMEKMFFTHQEGERKEGILLQLHSDHYLYNQFDAQAQVSGGRIEYVRTFAVAALLLLLISCINFVNLATARASRRAQEVGVRKTIGATRFSLIGQFMTEAAVITLISISIAYIAAEALLPYVQQITGKELSFELNRPLFWAGLLGILCVTTFLSGAYPAFVLSAFRPIQVLKGKLSQRSGSTSFRKGLVVVQFVLALLLIVGALVVQQQVYYLQHKNLGLNKNDLLMIQKDEKIQQQEAVMLDRLLASPAIAGVTLAGPSPLDMQASTSGVNWPEKRPDQSNIEFQILWTRYNFPEVFEVPLVDGEYYREGPTSDTTHIVFNEKAIEIMGLEDPVGKTIEWWGQPRQIIGVLKDFHNRSLYEEIEPAGALGIE